MVSIRQLQQAPLEGVQDLVQPTVHRGGAGVEQGHSRLQN